MSGCTVENCGRPLKAKGFCNPHYQRYYAYGDPLAGSLRHAPMEERFWARVDKTASCWNWTAAKSAAGYGQLWDGERVVYTHRYSYELHVGPIPGGLAIDHLCRNRACCNPAHLEAVTTAENTRRAQGEITECVHGHSYLDGDNVYIRPDGRGRQCRTCGNEKRRALRNAS